MFTLSPNPAALTGHPARPAAEDPGGPPGGQRPSDGGRAGGQGRGGGPGGAGGSGCVRLGRHAARQAQQRRQEVNVGLTATDRSVGSSVQLVPPAVWP